MLVRLWRNWVIPALVVQPLWKLVWHFHFKLKMDLQYDLTVAFPGIYPRDENLCMNVNSSCICNSQKLESTQVPFSDLTNWGTSIPWNKNNKKQWTIDAKKLNNLNKFKRTLLSGKKNLISKGNMLHVSIYIITK